jgi:hypothetical protein
MPDPRVHSTSFSRLEAMVRARRRGIRCGIQWTQLGKVERGQRSLRLETMVKIAAGLDIDAEHLVSNLRVPRP